MGVVFEARDENLERPVALKVIAPELAEDAEFRARFTREAQAQALLDSRHVVQVYAHGEDEGRLWIATQLVPDGDLRSMLSSHGAPSVPRGDRPDRAGRRRSRRRARRRARAPRHQAGQRAAASARRRRATPPTSPTSASPARSTARRPAPRTRPSARPSYMAPELHTGGQPGVASDVYSLGCLLWATLTGRAPYVGTSDFEIVTAHREQPVPQLPDDGPLAASLNERAAPHPGQGPGRAARPRRPRSATGSARCGDPLPRPASPPPRRRGRSWRSSWSAVLVGRRRWCVAYAVTSG